MQKSTPRSIWAIVPGVLPIVIVTTLVDLVLPGAPVHRPRAQPAT